MNYKDLNLIDDLLTNNISFNNILLANKTKDVSRKMPL